VTDQIDFEALFRAAPAGAVVAAADGTILDVNDRFTAWTGLAHDELLGTSFLRLLPVGDRIVFSTRTAPLLDLAGQVPEIAVTVLGAGRTRLPAMLGVAQVMTEPAVTLFVLAPRRERSVEEAQLISAVHRAEDSEARRRAAEDDLERVARHDALTGLLNRTGLVGALTDGPASVHSGSDVGALWIGLDHFRVVVESLGHAAGDDVLSTIAQRLRDRFGEPTLLGRVGGDEFVVVLPGANPEQHADDILALVAEPMMADDLEIVVSASVGVATAGLESQDVPGSREAADALLRQASAGMYAAKAAGRNRWKRTAAITDGAAVNEIRLLGESRAALADDQLRLEYQPQLDLRTGRLHGVEALIRWDHPTRGPVPPGSFIDVAEKSGLISQIGTWTCATAIAQAVELNNTAGVPVQMSVNISARQLGEPRFAGTVASLLGATDLDPGLLTLELTETGLITDAPQVRENLMNLHEQGVQLSIDDFGTGHASIAYLNDFPIDEIKIDRSYVDRLDSPEGSAIVLSCIELAHALSVSVVAEGVETSDQLTRLAELGCDIVQGYHYSRPLSPDALSTWLTDGR
jgi:diguanylate cyclase (GGDEF)-like protein